MLTPIVPQKRSLSTIATGKPSPNSSRILEAASTNDVHGGQKAKITGRDQLVIRGVAMNDGFAPAALFLDLSRGQYAQVPLSTGQTRPARRPGSSTARWTPWTSTSM